MIKKVRVKVIRRINAPTVVCDLSISDNHNLFVCNQISDFPILAHNCFDENLRGLNKFGKSDSDMGIFSLGQTTLNYGCDFYENASFSKKERATIANVPLKGDVLDYAVADTQIPFAIHRKQLLRAKNSKYKNGNYLRAYYKLMLLQMSSIVHALSQLEERGIALDISYLMKLKSADGPVETMAREVMDKLKSSKAARRVNRKLQEDAGTPDYSLFSNEKQSSWVFKLSKPLHKQMLYIDELKLKPLSHGTKGAPSIDANFMATHKGVPEVEILSQISELEKLRSSYVNNFAKRFHTDPDFKKDRHLRSSYAFLTVTGRTMSADPNLQQIPSRKKQAKLIKRLLIAGKGRLIKKMDFSAHEVRLWSVVSNDKLLADLFTIGRNLRIKFRETEIEKYKLLMDTEGDIHKQNVRFFNGTPIDQVTKDQRGDIKGIVFGAIYGRSAASIARMLDKDKKGIEILMDRFFKRFPNAAKWLMDAKKTAVNKCYVNSPIDRLRHMYAQLYEINALIAGVERRGSNAPIQGFGADIAHVAAHLYDWHIEKTYRIFDENGICDGIHTMVHDSLEEDRLYEYLIPSLQIHQWVATLGAEQYYQRHWNVEFPCHLEVDFDLGADGSRLRKWDWSETGLKDIITKGLEDQVEIYPDLNVKKALREIYAYKDNVKLCRYLDKHYPVLGELP